MHDVSELLCPLLVLYARMDGRPVAIVFIVNVGRVRTFLVSLREQVLLDWREEMCAVAVGHSMLRRLWLV